MKQKKRLCFMFSIPILTGLGFSACSKNNDTIPAVTDDEAQSTIARSVHTTLTCTGISGPKVLILIPELYRILVIFPVLMQLKNKEVISFITI